MRLATKFMKNKNLGIGGLVNDVLIRGQNSNNAYGEFFADYHK